MTHNFYKKNERKKGNAPLGYSLLLHIILANATLVVLQILCGRDIRVTCWVMNSQDISYYLAHLLEREKKMSLWYFPSFSLHQWSTIKNKRKRWLLTKRYVTQHMDHLYMINSKRKKMHACDYVQTHSHQHMIVIPKWWHDRWQILHLGLSEVVTG